MANVDILQEILDWSSTRPPWQCDALRRLVTRGEIDDDDVNDLTNICKARHGLAAKRKPEPLEAKHLPEPGAGSEPVSLTSLTHHEGVNALARAQTIEFGPSLTIVYGANAAGKSGYTRILKRACRARGAEEILGNVVAGTAPGRPSSTIKFDVGGTPSELLWDDDQAGNSDLGRVSVFDRHCASVYIAQQTDVAFRPLGLDLFDKLSDACEAVRKALDKERKELAATTLEFPNVPEGTRVHDLVSHVTSLTDPEAVKELASLSEAEMAHMEELRKRLQDLQSHDPDKTGRALELRAKRVEALAEKIGAVAETLSDSAIAEVFTARDRMIETRQAAEQMRRATFEEQPLPNGGSDAWRALWAAAERFSTAEAYPDQPFPVTGEDSRCVFCQQELQNDGAERLRQFHEFLSSAVQRDSDKATTLFQGLHKRLGDLVVADDPTTQALEELEIEDSTLADTAKECLEAAEERREAVTTALEEDLPCPPNLPEKPLDSQVLAAQVQTLRDRAEELRKGSHPEAKAKFQEELQELYSRRLLGSHLAAVLQEIERKKKLAAYQLCLDDTTTTGITRKGSEVTKRAVTEQLAKSFKQELRSLDFRHIEVEMTAAGGARGALYHKLQLKRAPGVSVPKVVSEGEALCLSIASFFAELSTTPDRSTILFDDPVSSLDHTWRGNVARRLVLESQSRQVVVFTHDIVFLLTLMEHARDNDVDLTHQYLRRDRTGAGLCAKELPWEAMPVSKRIGHLRALRQDAEKLHRTGDQQEYERDAIRIYDLLRKAWERAVEEVLLYGIVERYRNSVQTQRSKYLADITDADCRALDAGMTKTSKWLHDQAPAESAPVPDPSELQDDINALDDWVKGIRKRRK
ncbi:MAG: AAA family ATPase [Planctomycetes bacterium]|nr:AAA family ATPase [Planctomycetota bacterium]